MTDQRNGETPRKQAILKEIIRDLHAGVPVERLQKTFAKLIRDTSAEEIADMENALIREGFPPEEIQRLCDVHAQVFQAALRRVGKPAKVPGHPVHTFMQENKEAKRQLKVLIKLAKRVKKGRADQRDIEMLRAAFSQFRDIEKHYLRKENQLFPALEAVGFTGPTQVMWGKHDEIRASIKEAQEALDAGQWDPFYLALKEVAAKVARMIFLEEKILYPTSMRKLTDADWARIKHGESEIGYAWVQPPDLWDANLAVHASASRPETPGSGQLPLSEGRLSLEQIDLMLKALPIEISFVDENDQVCYYSATEERIFPRSPGVIGRSVQNCHPPKSLHLVNEIIESFRNKTRRVAEFWIPMGGRFIHIRYFPLYDAQGRYRGVVEVTQDVTEIRRLQGEKRLLDEPNASA